MNIQVENIGVGFLSIVCGHALSIHDTEKEAWICGWIFMVANFAEGSIGDA